MARKGKRAVIKASKKMVKRAVRKVRNNRQPVLARRGLVMNRGPIQTGRGNKLVLKHKEAAIELFGTGGERVTASALVNPGDSFFMRWGSRIARNYETYKFKKLRIVWEPSLPATADGYLRMYIDFDARDSAAASSVDAMSAYGAISGNIWSKLALTASTANLNKLKSRYVRERGNQILSQIGYDRTSDAGLLHIYYSTSLANTVSLGIFFVEYEVELETPQIELMGTPTYSRYGTPAFNPSSGDNDVYSLISGQSSTVTEEVKQGVTTVEGPANFTTGALAENLLNLKQPGLYKLVSQLPLFVGENSKTEAQILEMLSNLMPFVRDTHNTTNTTIVPADTTAPHGKFTFNTDNLGDGAGPSGHTLMAQATKYFNITEPTTLAVRVLKKYVSGVDYAEHSTQPQNVAVSRIGDYSFLDILKPKANYPKLLTDPVAAAKPTASFGAAYV